MTCTIDLPEMPARMRRHQECLERTAELEQELYGEVISPSVERQLESYRWWPPGW